MIDLILIIVLLASALALPMLNSEMDTIKHRPKQAWKQTKWWLGNNWTLELYINAVNLHDVKGFKLLFKKFISTKFGWRCMKDPLSILLDGWHFIKGIYVYLIALLISLNLILILGLSINLILILPIVCYTIMGAIFNYFFYR